MLPVSRRFLGNLGTAEWLPRVEWSSDLGASWQDVTYLDGSPTADNGSQVRWSTDLHLADVSIDRRGFSLFATLIRVSLGMVFASDDVEWCPLGVYTVGDDDVSVARDGTVSLQGQSSEQVVLGDRFLKPRTFDPQLGSLLWAQLLTESVPWASRAWRVDDLVLPKMIEERDRWGLVDGRTGDPSIARALGARCFCDGRGVFVMAPVPSLADEPVWAVADGADGVQVELAETYSAAGVRNVWSVRGVADDGTPAVGPVVLGDTAPNSPTRMSLRRKPGFYASPLLKTVSQCQTVALGLLAPNLGYSQTIALTSVLNPALEVGDVISVTMLDGSVQRHICDRIAYDLANGTMQIDGRAASTALVGQPVDLSTVYGTDDEDSGAGVDDAS